VKKVFEKKKIQKKRTGACGVTMSGLERTGVEPEEQAEEKGERWGNRWHLKKKKEQISARGPNLHRKGKRKTGRVRPLNGRSHFPIIVGFLKKKTARGPQKRFGSLSAGVPENQPAQGYKGDQKPETHVGKKRWGRK